MKVHIRICAGAPGNRGPYRNARMESPCEAISVALQASPSYKIMAAPTNSITSITAVGPACVHQSDQPSTMHGLPSPQSPQKVM